MGIRERETSSVIDRRMSNRINVTLRYDVMLINTKMQRIYLEMSKEQEEERRRKKE